MTRKVFTTIAAFCFATVLTTASLHARQSAANSQAQTQQAPATPQIKSQSPSSTAPGSQSMQDMPGMEGMPGMDHAGTQQAEAGANHEMMRGHHHMGAHMHMTDLRAANPGDWDRADKIAAELRDAIEPYKDYKVALADGFRPFLPNLPQEIYHFTNYSNGFLESFTFDPTRPTSLLYKKNASGYELVGAMYTMPRSATEEQLNERVPLSVAQWHLHTNLCMPPKGARMASINLKEFGLEGAITTQQGCDAAGGRFYPVVFGWMVHVYPFESTRKKIWEQ
jgi:hypothetical protein